MNVSKFATMPRPGIRRDAQKNRLLLMREKLKSDVERYRAYGHSTLAARSELALRFVTHELMKLGAFR